MSDVRVEVREETTRIEFRDGGAPGPRGARGDAGEGGTSSASDNVPDPLQVWTMIHDLGYSPAGWQFFKGQDGTGDQMDPESITHPSDTVSIATWLTAVPGSWIAS